MIKKFIVYTFVACLILIINGSSHTLATRSVISDKSVYPELFSPDGDGYKDVASFSYSLSVDSLVTIKVYNYRGEVRTVIRKAYRSKGQHDEGWTGTDNSGHKLPPGNYRYEIKAVNGMGDFFSYGLINIHGYWDSFGYNNSKAGFNGDANIDLPLQRKWQYTIKKVRRNKAIELGPVMKGDKIFFSSNSGYVYALSLKSGRLLWKFKTFTYRFNGKMVRNLVAAPVAWRDRLYINACDGYVYCLRSNNGKLVWRKKLGGKNESPPLVQNDKVVVGTGTGRIYALSAFSGNIIWELRTGGAVKSGGAVLKNIVYFGSYDGVLYAININSGRLIWSYKTGSSMFSTPSVSDGKVYIGTLKGGLFAVNAYSGKLVWKYNGKFSIYGSPSIYGSNVYVASMEGRLHALNKRTGKWVWTFSGGLVGAPRNGYRNMGKPAIASGKVFYSPANNHLYALSVNTGKALWSVSGSRYKGYGSAVIDGRNVYFATARGRVFKFGPAANK